MNNEREDGLLRGSREEREQAMLSLAKEEWDLDTLLALHLGLLDHTQNVNLSSLEALMKIAGRNPKPFFCSPIQMLVRFIFSVTVASGYRERIFHFLAHLNTDEANQAVESILKENLNWMRNEDLEAFVRILAEVGKWRILKGLKGEKLSKAKRGILAQVLKQHIEE